MHVTPFGRAGASPLLVLAACVQISLCASLAKAQWSGPPARLTVSVTDATQAVVAGAAVRLVVVESNRLITSAQTDAQGQALFNDVLPGDYDVRVTHDMFTPQTARVSLPPGRLTTISFRLPVASVRQVVTVVAAVDRPLEQEDLSIVAVREGSAKDVGDAMEQLPGLWKVRRGGIANDVVLRGFQREDVAVQVDGLRVYGACPNHMDPPAFHVDFAEVERVEVVKGPYDITSQGSLGGAVNIVRKKQAPGVHVTPRLSLGSFGFVNPSVAASYANDRTRWGGGLSFRAGDDYRDGRGRLVTDYANFKPGADRLRAFAAATGWFSFGFMPTSKQRLDISYARQQAGRTLYPYLQMDAIYDHSDRAQAEYLVTDPTPRIRSVSLQVYLSLVRHWMTDEWRQSAVGALDVFSMATYATTRSIGGKAEAATASWTFGAESFHRNWNALTAMRRVGMVSDQAAIPDVGTRVTAAWAGYTRSITDRLRVTAGARVQTAVTGASPALMNVSLVNAYLGGSSSSAADTSPSGNVRVTLRLPRDAELFAGAGTAVRVPDASERYYNLKRAGSDWVGNPWLRPTRNTQADLGLRVGRRRFSLTSSLFFSSLRDYISVYNRAIVARGAGIMNIQARSYENVHARIYGGEFAYRGVLTNTLTISGSLSLVRGSRDPKPGSRIFDTNLAEMPALKSYAALRYARGRIFVEAEGRADGPQRRVDTSLQERPTAGYAVFGARAGLQWRRILVAGGVANIASRWYVEHLSYQRDPFRLGNVVPEPGRSIYLNAQWTY